MVSQTEHGCFRAPCDTGSGESKMAEEPQVFEHKTNSLRVAKGIPWAPHEKPFPQRTSVDWLLRIGGYREPSHGWAVTVHELFSNGSLPAIGPVPESPTFGRALALKMPIDY
jgi:hypothetical protein